MKKHVQDWLESGAYLPKPLRDFHDQKDLFKCIAELEPPKNYPMPDWVTAHIYTVDHFLWFMAKHGYTLQRSRANVKFSDLETRVKASRDARNQSFAKMLTKPNPQEDRTP
jgi:hypothetical protein